MWCRVSVGLIACWCLSGCMIVQVGVTNPMPEITTVAVAPFFNQSAERAIDGNRVATAYASELQKIPGIEVIPVGVVETRMREQGLQQLSGPEDALKLARALNADAVVIGSITDYKPYYPPRIGLSVAWYSPRLPLNSNAMPIDPLARERLKEDIDRMHGLGIRRNAKRHARETAHDLSKLADGFFLDDRPTNGWEPFRKQYADPNPEEEMSEHEKQLRDIANGHLGPARNINQPRDRSPGRNPQTERKSRPRKSTGEGMKSQSSRPTIRGQSADADLWPPAGTYVTVEDQGRRLPQMIATDSNRRGRNHHREHESIDDNRAGHAPPPRLFRPDDRPAMPIERTVGQSVGRATRLALRAKRDPLEKPGALRQNLPPVHGPAKMQPAATLPIMSYTRVFDAADSDLVAIWRDYLETTADQRPAGWVAQLYWSDNFIRFTTRLMIVEMFQLHGGEAKRRIILKLRKHR